MGGVRQARQAIEPPGEDAAHQLARGDDLRIGQPVADLAAAALGLDDAQVAHDGEVLGGALLGTAVGGSIGAVLGGLIGSAIPRWHRVY